MEATKLLKDVSKLPSKEQKLFHEMYLDLMEQRDWERLSEETLEWDEENDDYSDLFPQ